MKLIYYKASRDSYYNALRMLNDISTRTDFDERWLRWKFFDNPAGKARLYFAEDSDKGALCGMYCLYPWTIRIRGERVECAQAGDLVVHPDYRRRGIFRELTHCMLEDVKQSQLAMLIGFSNKAAFPGHMKFGWKYPGNLKNFVKVTGVDRLLSAAGLKLPRRAVGPANRCLNIRHALRNRRCRDFDFQRVDTFDGLPGETGVSCQEFETCRDDDYLRWRYTDNPSRDYLIFRLSRKTEPVCYLVLLLKDRVASIVDIIPTSDPSNILVANSFLICNLVEMGIDLIRCSCNGPVTEVLKKGGYLYREEGLPIIIYPIGNRSLLHDMPLDRWQLLPGDIDVT